MLDSTCAAPAAPSVRELPDRLFLACGLAWAACVIHIQAAVDHIGESVFFALVFVFLAAAQFLWGLAISRSPTRGLLYAGAVGSLMIVALWIVTRTSGLPFGPEAGSPEPVAVIDSIASADEAALALLVILQLGFARAGALLRGARHFATAAGVCLVVISSVALTYAGQAH